MDSVIPIVKAFILERFLPGESPDRLTPQTELVHSGILDSLATLDLVAFLEEEFGIELEAHDVQTHLGSIEAIDNMVQSKMARTG